MREATAQSSPFDENFDSSSYNNHDAVDNEPLWAANSGTNGQPSPTFPYISKSGTAGVAVIPVRNGTPPQTGFMQPIDSTGNPANWPFARTCENFLRVEFDLQPMLVTSGGGSNPDGVIGLYFTPFARQAGLGDSGPLAGILLSWKSGSTATAQIYAKWLFRLSCGSPGHLRRTVV
jgi:hypothetical protein